MTKAKPKRKVNKNVFYSRMILNGLTLELLGSKLSPPLRKVRVHNIITAGKPIHRLQEIAVILKSNVATLFPKITTKEDDRNVA